ncbi:transcriptional regulatory protein OmpR [mine drainage metagenome]|uniref:Transcriptional regulatory protein OmpR n=1 Tax=mine drainage metagenome TaxID=410659 RepID=A0A1J5P4U0_9ZZZZ
MSDLPDMEQSKHILIVDDDDDIRTLLSEFLERNRLTAFQAPDGESMRTILKSHSIDLVVLDLNLPGEDGLLLCRQIRSSSNLPIIMLTAKSDPIDRIMGLETGADDYVCKPFEPLELLSRIRSVLRRTQQSGMSEHNEQEPIRMYFSGWMLDLTARHLLNPHGVVISLSGAEFRLLKMFLDRPNRILSRDQLMDLMHGRDATAFDRSIDLQVSRLRQKIEHDHKAPSIIKTVRNEGYILATSVKLESR